MQEQGQGQEQEQEQEQLFSWLTAIWLAHIYLADSHPFGRLKAI